MEYRRPEDRGVLFQSLQMKFAANLQSALTCEADLFSRAELNARSITAIGTLMSQLPSLTATQRELLCIYDEIFADVVTSSYLAACALDGPGRMMLRRVLELGVASVYLWDLPHVFWGWKNHDKDLNFREMIDHLGSPSFRSFVQSENPSYAGTELIDAAAANQMYRCLSNVIHGKITTFESLLPDRFQHHSSDWRRHLTDVLQVQELLLRLWRTRFPGVATGLSIVFPQLDLL